MSRMKSGPQRRRPIRTMILRGHGGKRERKQLATDCKNLLELVGRYDLQLFEGAIARSLVVSPPTKLGGVTKAISLHVIVRDLNDKLGTQRLPRLILSLAPTALHPRLPMHIRRRLGVRPRAPRMILESIESERLEEFHQLFSLGISEARAHAHVCQVIAVVQAQKE